MRTQQYNLSDPYDVISFAIDNNPYGVADAMERAGHSVQGLSFPQLKETIYQAFLRNNDVSWLMGVQYNPTVGNGTDSIYYRTGNTANAKGFFENLTFSDIGTFIGQVAPVALAAFGLPAIGGLFGGSGGTNSGGSNQAYNAQHATDIWGMPRELFYVIIGVIIIVVAIAVFAHYRKK